MANGKFPFGKTLGPSAPQPVGPPILRDRYGRELHIGDQVVLPNVIAPVLRVADVKPDMRPNVPPGTLLVQLVLPPVILQLPGGQAMGDLIRVMQVAEYEKPKPAEEPPPDKQTSLIITE